MYNPTLKNIIILLRPQQWSKNLFIYLPVFFNRQINDTDSILTCSITFIAFSLIASSIYCFNDIHDVNKDRVHAKKKLRPIASGKITIRTAYFIMFSLILAGILLLQLGFYLLGKDSAATIKAIGIISLYFLMNIAYCIKLKQIPILDTFIIATGFVLRILIGGYTTDINLSQWIIVMTFLLALFLAFAKRRDDVIIYTQTGIQTRKSIERYNLEFMNQALSIIAAVTMVSYILYTVSPEVISRMHSDNLFITAIFVLAGLLRYLQITLVDINSGSPTAILLSDRFIQCCICGWMLSFTLIIYFEL